MRASVKRCEVDRPDITRPVDQPAGVVISKHLKTLLIDVDDHSFHTPVIENAAQWWGAA